MSSLSNIALPKPKDWQDFERKTRVLFVCVLADPNTQMNGRTGQPQHGVDIWGYRNEDRHRLVGIQCKKSDDEVTDDELEAELEKAKGFDPPISEFILVTTAPRDQKIQQRARQLTESLLETERPISVTVWGWEDVEEQAAQHVDAHRAFDPTFNPYVERVGKEILARLDQIALDKGVPTAPLCAILEKLGVAGVPDYEIPTRLDAAADELLGLRAHLARLRNDPPELAAVREEALALIDRGELDRARAVLNRGREAARALREEASRSEAELLANGAQIDHLQLAYCAAAAKYAEAADLVAPFDRYNVSRLLLRQADALFNQGDEFGDNEALIRAIDIYRRAAALISQADFPVDWATTWNDLGNTLAALGEREADTARLEEALAAHHEALKEFTRESAPLRWAGVHNNLGNTLRALGELEDGTTRFNQAVAAYHEALKEWTRERAPLNWAGAQLNLSNVLSALGERETGTSRLKEAVVACRKTLKEFTRERVPLQWALSQNNLGTALQMLGVRERNTARLKRAISAYHKALTERTRERLPLDWAMTQNNLGNTFLAIGLLETGVAGFEQAVAAYHEALKEFTRERAALRWAQTQYNLANASSAWGERESGTARLEQAVAAYDEALKVYTPELMPLLSARITGKQGDALTLLAERLGDSSSAQTAVHQISLAVAILREANDMEAAAYFEIVLGKAVALLNQLTRR
jgi:tetratricopeptide (TPR) repeat protein